MAVKYDLLLRTNETWECTITIKKLDGTPFDLSTFNGQAQVKNSYSEVSPLVTLSVVITDAVNGVLKVFLPLTQATLLTPTSTHTPPRPPLPVWDVVIYNVDRSQVYTLYYGSVTVKPGVTVLGP